MGFINKKADILVVGDKKVGKSAIIDALFKIEYGKEILKTDKFRMKWVNFNITNLTIWDIVVP